MNIRKKMMAFLCAGVIGTGMQSMKGMNGTMASMVVRDPLVVQVTALAGNGAILICGYKALDGLTHVVNPRNGRTRLSEAVQALSWTGTALASFFLGRYAMSS